MFYVYCIESRFCSGQLYFGFTGDLRGRLRDHNGGFNPSTLSGRPWKLRGYIAFDNKTAALAFERYLKTGSGHAFRRKRLWR